MTEMMGVGASIRYAMDAEYRRGYSDGKGAVEDDESPYPTQAQMDAEDARDLYRLAHWLHENQDDTRLACEPIVEWAMRLITNWRPSSPVIGRNGSEVAGNQSPGKW